MQLAATMVGMRAVCGVLAGLCWLFVAAAFLGLLFVVFKPRAQNADIYPAAVMYLGSLITGVGSVVTGLLAQRRLERPDLLVRLWLVAATAGLVLPAMLVIAILRDK